MLESSQCGTQKDMVPESDPDTGKKDPLYGLTKIAI